MIILVYNSMVSITADLFQLTIVLFSGIFLMIRVERNIHLAKRVLHFPTEKTKFTDHHNNQNEFNYKDKW